jgi:hypothetical protein
MKFAYADPVYLGQSRLYPEHPESYLWDDPETHRILIEWLVYEFPDGWGLSCSTPSLRVLLPMCPEDVRIASWVKTFCAFKKGVRPCYAWEPVIFWRGRNKNHPPPEKGGKQTTPKDFLLDDTDVESPAFAGPITLKKGLTGAKPEKFCRWVLDLLNVRPGDEFHDIYPGTGVMTRVAAEVLAG